MEEVFAVCEKVCQDQALKHHGQAMAVLLYLVRAIPGRGMDSAVIRRADIASAIGIGELGGVTRDLRLLENRGYIEIKRQKNKPATISLRAK